MKTGLLSHGPRSCGPLVIYLNNSSPWSRNLPDQISKTIMRFEHWHWLIKSFCKDRSVFFYTVQPVDFIYLHAKCLMGALQSAAGIYKYTLLLRNISKFDTTQEEILQQFKAWQHNVCAWNWEGEGWRPWNSAFEIQNWRNFSYIFTFCIE